MNSTDLAVTGGGSLEAVPVQPNALQAIQSAEVDIQIATAHKYPRSITKFMQSAMDMVTTDRATAAACIYRRPVGKEGGKMKFVEGESIRMAEIVAASYQNLRIASMITEINGREVKACAMCHDLENNVAIRADTIESTLTKNGTPFSDRMQLVVAKAAQSKAIRDAIFRIVPKAMCQSIKQAAEDTAIGKNKTLDERRAGVMAWIQELEIAPQRVFNALGIEGIEELGRSALIDLVGIRTALDNGDITVKDAFPEEEKDLSATEGRTKFGPRTQETESGTDAPAKDVAKEKKTTRKSKGKGAKEGAEPADTSDTEENAPDPDALPDNIDELDQPEPQGEPDATDQPSFVCVNKKCKQFGVLTADVHLKKVQGKEAAICKACIGKMDASPSR